MKNFIWLFLILARGVWGCVSVDHTTLVDADQSGYASGQYRDVRHGTVANFGIFGAGAGAAAADSASAALSLTAAALTGGAKSAASSGGGGGMLGLRVYPAPSQGDPMPFARSIAMINYSKKLTRVSYDDCGLVSYEFGEPNRRPLPSSFGHQPVQ
jgi:hypothetical protein